MALYKNTEPKVCYRVLCRTRKRNTWSKAAYLPERGSNASTREAGPAEIVLWHCLWTIVQ